MGNYHPGNGLFRKDAERLSKQYTSPTTTKSEKTFIKQTLVDIVVRNRGGRFLVKEIKAKGATTSSGQSQQKMWYVVDSSSPLVMKKAHQALRENRDPIKRKAKRKRFLAKHKRRY